jgi:DNA-binding NtrC family response regulator
MSHVALLGLPEDLGNQLTRILLEESHQVSHKRFISDLRRLPASSAVFISGDTPEYRRTISILRESHPHLPVIVVTRQSDAWHWLDALDAGAAEYCGAPFERFQLRWILDSIPAALPGGVAMARAS